MQDENIDPNQSLPPMSSQQVLGNLTHTWTYFILNMIMRQAEREGLVKSLGYPNLKVWVKNNLGNWFGNCEVLSNEVW
jgi:hypothetical protein